MLTLLLLGLAFTMACLTATLPIYQFLAFSTIVVTYLLLLDKEH